MNETASRIVQITRPLLVSLCAAALIATFLTACSTSETTEEEEEPEQTLYESVDFGTMEWPTSGAAENVPVPSWAVVEDDGTVKITGELEKDSAEAFECKVAATEDDFNDYVKACKSAGYTVDYNGSSDSYEASNENGSELTIEFNGDPWFYDISFFTLAVTAPIEEEDSAESTEEDAEEEEAVSTSDESDDAEAESDSTDSDASTCTISDDGGTGLEYTFEESTDNSATFKVTGTEDAVNIEIYSVEVDGTTYDVSDSSEFVFTVDGYSDGANYDYIADGVTRTWEFSCPAVKSFSEMKVWYEIRIFSLDSSGAVMNSWDYVEQNLIIKK